MSGLVALASMFLAVVVEQQNMLTLRSSRVLPFANACPNEAVNRPGTARPIRRTHHHQQALVVLAQ
jgi:hypothetical protein